MRVPFLLIGCLAVVASRASSAQRLDLSRHLALADEPISLRTHQTGPATLSLTLRDTSGQLWSGRRELRGDTTLDISRLIATLTVDGKPGARFQYTSHDTITTVLSLSIGARNLVDTIRQVFKADDVRTRVVRDNGLVGTLYTPNNGGSAAALLVLGGSEGGVGSEDVAAMLASHGFVAFALGYFDAESLPEALDRIPLEYFASALAWLKRQPHVDSRRVGILATSKGTEAALLVASSDSTIRAVVAYAPSSLVWSCICADYHSSWARGGHDVPFIPPGRDPTYKPLDGAPLSPAVNYAYRMRDPSVRALAAIPTGRVAARLMLIAGAEDSLWPSADMARALAAGRAGRNDVVLVYPGAGHLIGKSYLPAGSTLVAGGHLQTGGTPEGNASAQADSWPRVLRFLSASLQR